MRERLLAHAMALTGSKHYSKITRDDVANAADVSPGSVSYHFGSAGKMRGAIVNQAIVTENLKVIGEALAQRHPKVLALPNALRRRAILYIVGLG